MPRNVFSDMQPFEFHFYREYIGFTTQDIAEILGVQNRTVQAWDRERNASVPAKNFVLDETSKLNVWVENQLKDLLAQFAKSGGEPVQLVMYKSVDDLPLEYNNFRKITHYEAALKALVSVLSQRGIKFNFTS